METKNLFETFTTAQKQAVENMTSATENMNKMFSENMNSDFFKKWYDSQMSFFNNGENKMNNPMDLYTSWMNNPMDASKNWMNSMPGMNNASLFNQDSMMANMNNTMNMYQNWMESMKNTYTELMKNYSNMDSKNMMSGMFNNADMHMNMFQLWMPMFKSMNDKSFDMETFKSMFNAPLFKDMMDKMFNMTDLNNKMMSFPGVADFQKNMNSMMDSNKNIFDNMKANMANFMPNNNQMFTQTMDMYNNMNFQMNNAFAPMMKLMGNNAQTQQMNVSKELANEFVQYQLRSTEMQYMMYNTGMKAMDELAETVYNNIRNGNEVKDFTNLYTTWLTISDKHFVELFSTEEYSKMQADLNSFGMKIKSQINSQMEKSLANIPVISRTEMDETYKTIYEMKKRITMLEKQLDAETATEETAPKAAPKKAAKNA
jgi:polyhydroxyalkanoate synthase subunit PhaE